MAAYGGGSERTAARGEEELRAALEHLRAVHGAYWERGRQRTHRGRGRYPEHHLWEAVAGCLDLLDTRDPPDAGSEGLRDLPGVRRAEDRDLPDVRGERAGE